ncbi:MAG: Imidazoleglycerol-phosphate dehydratase, partial [Pseudomonadota bacterium]
ENSHHIAEASFKSLARALRAATVVDDRLKGQVASTKGSL